MCLAPDLSATPEHAYDEHKIHEAQVDWHVMPIPRDSACLLPEAPMYQTNDIDHDDEGEHGPSEPDTWWHEEDLGVPQHAAPYFLSILFMDGEWS